MEEVSRGIDGLTVRYTLPTDTKFMIQWFEEKEIWKWFPFEERWEMEDSVKRMVNFCRFRASLTAMMDGVPCGLAVLYLQPYKKLAHQAEFGMIVSQAYRNRGIGTLLLNELQRLAKEQFKLEILHLQVYDGNPAIRLYERAGFVPFGRQEGWIKENGQYLARIFMEKYL